MAKVDLDELAKDDADAEAGKAAGEERLSAIENKLAAIDELKSSMGKINSHFETQAQERARVQKEQEDSRKAKSVEGDEESEREYYKSRGWTDEKIDELTKVVNLGIKKSAKGTKGFEELNELKAQLKELQDKVNNVNEYAGTKTFQEVNAGYMNDPTLNSFEHYPLPYQYWYGLRVDQPLQEGKLDPKVAQMYKSNPRQMKADFLEFCDEVKRDPSLRKEAEKVRDEMRSNMKSRKLSATIPSNYFGLTSNSEEDDGSEKTTGLTLNERINKSLRERVEEGYSKKK
jgi:hypothetical protein